MKKDALYLLIALSGMLLGSCESEKTTNLESYTLEVHLSGGYDDYLFLTGDEMDSVLVVDGIARFTGDKTPPEQVAVIPKGTSISPAWIFLENSDIKMYCRYIPATDTRPQMIRVDSIVGSTLQRLLDEWREDYQEIVADRENPESLNSRLTRRISEKIELSDNLGSWILARTAESLSREQVLALYHQLDTAGLPGSEIRMIERALTRKSNLGKSIAWENYELIAPGSGKNLGHLFSAADGKHKLLHFWATWCGPCIQNFPMLDSVIEKHQSGLEPVGLSIDFDSTRWHNFLMNEKRLSGEYLLREAWDHPLAKDLEIDHIPYYILLDENDKMIRQGGLPEVIAGLKE